VKKNIYCYDHNAQLTTNGELYTGRTTCLIPVDSIKPFTVIREMTQNVM